MVHHLIISSLLQSPFRGIPRYAPFGPHMGLYIPSNTKNIPMDILWGIYNYHGQISNNDQQSTPINTPHKTLPSQNFAITGKSTHILGIFWDKPWITPCYIHFSMAIFLSFLEFIQGMEVACPESWASACSSPRARESREWHRMWIKINWYKTKCKTISTSKYLCLNKYIYITKHL